MKEPSWTSKVTRRIVTAAALTSGQLQYALAEDQVPSAPPKGEPAAAELPEPGAKNDIVAHVHLPVKARIVLIGGGISGRPIERVMKDEGYESPDKVPVEVYDPKGMYREMFERFGLRDQSITVITSASKKFNETGGRDLKTMFELMGVKHVHVIDTHDAEKLGKAGDKEVSGYLKPLEDSPFVFVDGGDQKWFRRIYNGTKAEEIITRRCREDEKFIYAGTSAGAMIPSHRMPFRENDDAPDVVEQGIGILPFSVDTHFHRVGRPQRLAKMLREEMDDNGVAIGLDEGTAVEVFDGEVRIFSSRSNLKDDSSRVTVMTRTKGEDDEGPIIRTRTFVCKDGMCIIRSPAIPVFPGIPDKSGDKPR